jgi:HEAT repeat protein
VSAAQSRVSQSSRSGDELVWPGSIEDIAAQLGSEDAEARRRAATDLVRLPAGVKQRLLPGLFSDPDPEIKLAVADAALSIRWREAGSRVLPWLGDSDVRVREAAAEVLSVIRHPDSLPGLGRLLEDQEASARVAAATALGNSRRADASLLLMGHLDDSEPEVRRAVMSALADLGDARAVVPLIGRTRESRATLRRQAVAALGSLGDAKATSAVLVALGDADPTVRAAASTSLGKLRASEAVWALGTLLDTELDSDVVAAALDALGALGTPAAIDRILAVVEKPDSARAAEAALLRAGLAALPRLERCVVEAAPPAAKRVCASALGGLGGAAASRLLERALRQGLVEPAFALAALGRAADPESAPTVLEYLASAVPAERRAAVDALGTLLNPERRNGLAVEPLVAALARARGARLEQAALIGLLGRTGSARAAVHLVPIASSPDEFLRATAMEALARIGPAGADRVLLEALDSPAFPTRWTAAFALAQVGERRSIDALFERLERAPQSARELLGTALGGPLSRGASPEQMTRVATALHQGAGAQKDALIESVARIPGAQGLDLLKARVPLSNKSSRAKIAEVLGALPEARETLRALLADRDAAVRANAAWSLGATGVKDDVARLSEAAIDRDGTVAANAVGALALLAQRTAEAQVAPVLCAALLDARSYVLANALSGLRLTGEHCSGSDAAEWLLEHHASDEVRLAAARLIAAQPRWATDAPRALAACAAKDPSGRVARACAAAPAPLAERTLPVLVWVVPAGSSSPAGGLPFALVRADGLIRSGLTDRRGALLEPHAPDGEHRLTVPAAFAD